MNPNNGESSRYGSGKKGGVIPRERDHVSTMVGKKIVEYGEKAAKSTAEAFKTHKNKNKINPQD
ncbi:hypothetical protein F511_47325 [Dorcoceras hygrometricum]|uniref:Uncharacterized protein n=1 Tax=Dorcoceras hygrometricum TaxID=472368 RepID=A0A2Z6ZYJ5_9LAMI|nr:hypothetical protein F511_47325 [Dorcoceras hygrometricum]